MAKRAYHDGFVMRSMAERSWARIFDALDIGFQYEPETLLFGDEGYKPDFWLPLCGAYFEVKGPEPTLADRAKADKAMEITGLPVIFGYGSGVDRCVMARIKGRWHSFSLVTLGDFIERVAGFKAGARFFHALKDQRGPEPVQALLHCAAVGMYENDRAKLEAAMDRGNARPNIERMQKHGPPGLYEAMAQRVCRRLSEA